MSDDMRPIVELRSAVIAEVKFPERIITVLAVPYETPTDKVIYRGRQYIESFARGAFDGIEARAGRVMCNLEHRKGDTVGKVVAFYPDAHEGLIEDAKIAKTSAGDDLLELAADGMKFPSVGFAVIRGSDQELDHRSTPYRRYVRRAFQDHLGFVEDPAYTTADVLGVRAATADDLEIDVEPLSTPRLDEWVQYLQSRRAGLSA